MMIQKIHLFSAVTLMLLLGASPLLDAKRSSKKEEPAKLELVCETDGIVPGEILNLGLHIRHEPGWHTYWKNPGDVGMPPKVEWTGLPEGMEQQPVIWAPPELHKMGIIDVQSYHGEVLHIHPLLVPANLEPGKKVTLKGKLSWLMCSRKCIPAWQDVEITLPVLKEAKSDPKWQKQFAKTREGQPVKLDWKLEARTVGDHIELKISPRVLPKGPQEREMWFFCNENHISTQELPRISHDKDSTILRLLKTEWAPAKIPRLTGHIYLKKGWDAEGKIHNLLVEIPLDKDS
jgi:DsbC/DsbD-like thiol-disulfide interchange protein